MIYHYPAVIEGDDAGGYGVTFPDFPGCAAAGETIEEAVANAGEALLFHMDGTAEDGDPIPEPSRLDAPLRTGWRAAWGCASWCRSSRRGKQFGSTSRWTRSWSIASIAPLRPAINPARAC